MEFKLGNTKDILRLVVSRDPYIIFRQEERAAAAELFHPSSGLFRETIAIFGYDGTGRLVHTQVVGIDDTDERLSDHIRGKFPLYSLADQAIDPLKCRVSVPRDLDVAGRIAHHGELWMHPCLSGQGLGTRLANLGIEFAHELLGFDLIWALVGQEKTKTNFLPNIGYLHHFGPVIQWRGGGEPLDEWIAWTFAEELVGYRSGINPAGVVRTNSSERSGMGNVTLS